MGHDRVTVQNLKVVKVDRENHLLALKGSVPGAENGYLIVRTALKRGKPRKWKVAGTLKEAPQAEQPKPENSEQQS